MASIQVCLLCEGRKLYFFLSGRFVKGVFESGHVLKILYDRYQSNPRNVVEDGQVKGLVGSPSECVGVSLYGVFAQRVERLLNNGAH